MSVQDEFATVDLVLNSNAETRAVDAFALALIKAERQARRVFTHLVYQFPVFSQADVANLKNTLAVKRSVYFEGFLRGIDVLSGRSVQTLVGPDYPRLRQQVTVATGHRNKIFHGQLTPHSLGRAELTSLVGDLKQWCVLLAAGANAEFNYDGFVRNSFQKSSIANISGRFPVQLNSVADYQAFIAAHMER